MRNGRSAWRCGPHAFAPRRYPAACGRYLMHTSQPPVGRHTLLRKLAANAVDSVFPPICLICNRVSEAFCPACRSEIVPVGDVFAPPGLSAARSAGEHTGSLRAAVLRLKFGRKTPLAAPLGELVALQLAQVAAAWQPELLVLVPIHWWRALGRGFNQAELLAEAAGQHSRLPRDQCAAAATTHRIAGRPDGGAAASEPAQCVRPRCAPPRRRPPGGAGG